MTDRQTDSQTDPESEKERAARRQGRAYQGAIEAVFAILIAVGAGIGIDRYFDTSPTFLLIGLGIGFTAFVLRLMRLGREIRARETLERASEPD